MSLLIHNVILVLKFNVNLPLTWHMIFFLKLATSTVFCFNPTHYMYIHNQIKVYHHNYYIILLLYRFCNT